MKRRIDPKEEELKASNEKLFMEMLAHLDPDLWLIKQTLILTKLNPAVIPRIVRGIFNIAVGTGWGVVKIEMRDKMVTRVLPEESDTVNQPVFVDETVDSGGKL